LAGGDDRLLWTRRQPSGQAPRPCQIEGQRHFMVMVPLGMLGKPGMHAISTRRSCGSASNQLEGWAHGRRVTAAEPGLDALPSAGLTAAALPVLQENAAGYWPWPAIQSCGQLSMTSRAAASLPKLRSVHQGMSQSQDRARPIEYGNKSKFLGWNVPCGVTLISMPLLRHR
jgi:hypothetical protein